MDDRALLLDLPMPLYLEGLPALARSGMARLLASRGIGRAPGASRALGGAPSASGGTPAAAGDAPLGQRIHDAVLLPARQADSWRALADTDAPEAALAAPDEARSLRALLTRDAWERAGWGALVDRGLPELTVAWLDAPSGLWLKARPDLLEPATSTVWELKTVPRQSRDAVVAFLAQPRNVLQSAVYRAAMRALTGRAWRFAWLAIETAPPRRIEAHALPPHLLRQGEWLMRDALSIARARGLRTPLDPCDWERWSVEPARRARLGTGAD